uniref:Cytotoxic T-lymphocyte protein 4-like isoform X5 n=1 Tax=Geotrypetes seraphini TaxID=260995 RepID=A0A6P8S713_GEOSA|nr:cytotoxic T-lymphocyte protein 4-like isoform X5 [Geotrypetes seraphini]
MGWPGISFLLLCFLVLIEISRTLNVSQSPPLIQSSLGKSVEMTCEIHFSKNTEKIKLEWIREGNLSLHCHISVYLQKSSNCCMNSLVNWKWTNCSWDNPRFLLKIDNISKEDSGLFICKVTREIPPPYRVQQGNGTTLEVQDPIIWPYIASAGTVVILVFVVTWYCMQKRRKSSSNSSSAVEPFYENVIRIRKKQTAKTSTPQVKRHQSHYTMKPTHKCRSMEQRSKLEAGAPKAGMKRC